MLTEEGHDRRTRQALPQLPDSREDSGRADPERVFHGGHRFCQRDAREFSLAGCVYACPLGPQQGLSLLPVQECKLQPNT